MSSSVERYLTTMRGNCVRCETTWALKCASPREGPWPRLPRQVPRSREPPSRPTGRCLPSSQQESCGSFRRALRCQRGSVCGGGDGMHGARLKAGGWGTRRAHAEHVAHGCDLGRVEAQLLVERRRALPSRKEGMRCGRRCGPGGGRAWRGGGASGMHGKGPTQGLGARARAERTAKIQV